jgi:hypothetical protein
MLLAGLADGQNGFERGLVPEHPLGRAELQPLDEQAEIDPGLDRLLQDGLVAEDRLLHETTRSIIIEQDIPL